MDSTIDDLRQRAAQRVVTRSTADNPLPPTWKALDDRSFDQKVDYYFGKLVFDEDRPLVQPRWLVREMVADGGIVFIGGQSGAGKSYVLLDLFRCLMTGAAFFGRVVERQCAAVLFAPEGQETIDARVAAMKRHHRITENLPFAFLGELPSIETEEGRAIIVALLVRAHYHFVATFGLPLGIVGMDTLAATFELADQNDSSEAAKRFRQIREIQTAVQAKTEHRPTMLPVHHYGKTIEAGLTGGHGWKGGADQVLSVITNKDPVTGVGEGSALAVAKNRNGFEGPVSAFELTYLGLGYREDGSEWGNLYLTPLLDQPSAIFNKKTTTKVPKHLRCFDDAFIEAMISGGQPHRIAMGAGPTVQAVRLVPDVRAVFFEKYQTGIADPAKSEEEVRQTQYQAKKKAFQRAVGNLGTKYATETEHEVEWIWQAVGDLGDKGDKGDKT